MRRQITRPEFRTRAFIKARAYGPFEQITATVSDYYAVTYDQIKGRSKLVQHTWPRQVTMALCVELTGATQVHVSKYFDRLPSSVNHAMSQFRNICEAYPNIAQEVEEIRSSFKRRVILPIEKAA